MTITVVKGVSAKVQADASLKNGTQSSNPANAVGVSSAVSSGVTANTDAAVANVRTKAQAGTEKIREFNKAKGVADSVADSIRSEGKTDAHGLDGLTAREYFG